MKKTFIKYKEKLYLKHWVIGLCRGDIRDIIGSKTFCQDIKWLQFNSIDHFLADPFLSWSNDGHLNIFLEDFSLDDFYGKISLLTVDNNFRKISQKMLLDTGSHLSYPFIYKENDKIYVFPESSHSGKLDCYEYNAVQGSLNFVVEILKLPLLDSTILFYKDKYWLFGTLNGKDSNSKLYIYFSDRLLGPYTPHPGNPVKDSINGSRPAGNFFQVDGVLYRPSQNCEKEYGESITINKINILNEICFDEEPHMQISPNMLHRLKHKVLTMHTINVLDEIIVVDGLKWTFSPKNQWKYFRKNREYAKQLKDSKSFNSSLPK